MILLGILESQIPSINRVLKWITQKSLKIPYESNNNRHAKHLTQNFRRVDLSRVHVLHHVQSHVIPTYTLRSIHVTEFRVSSISAPNSAERSRYAKYTEIGMALHGHECGDRGHAIRCDLNEKMVVQLNVIDPFISFRWLVTIREENRRPAHEHIARYRAECFPICSFPRCVALDRRCTTATRWIRVYGNCHVAWKLTLADFFFWLEYALCRWSMPVAYPWIELGDTFQRFDCRANIGLGKILRGFFFEGREEGT